MFWFKKKRKRRLKTSNFEHSQEEREEMEKLDKEILEKAKNINFVDRMILTTIIADEYYLKYYPEHKEDELFKKHKDDLKRRYFKLLNKLRRYAELTHYKPQKKGIMVSNLLPKGFVMNEEDNKDIFSVTEAMENPSNDRLSQLFSKNKLTDKEYKEMANEMKDKENHDILIQMVSGLSKKLDKECNKMQDSNEIVNRKNKKKL
jgi:hypothetical protein